MPLTTPVRVQQSEEGDYSPLPADVYQVQIVDVEEREGTKYQSSEKITQLLFKTKVVEEGEFKNRSLGIFVTPKWFAGGKNASPSKMFNLFKAVYSFYKKEVNIAELDAEFIGLSEINGLIGKQLRLTVQVNAGNKNKIDSMMQIKQVIAYEQAEATAGNEDIDPDDIPV